MVRAPATPGPRTTALIAVLISVLLLAVASACSVRRAPPRTLQTDAPAQDQGAADSIEVHGDWTVEVLEPDGRLASRHVFKNALLSPGREALGKLLSRNNSMGLWEVVITSDAPLEASQKPCTSGFGPDYCHIVEPTSAVAASSQTTKNLQVTDLFTGVRLTGTATAERDGALNRVQTNMQLCSNSIAPSSPCTSIATTFFSSRTLDSPITFVNGQIIQVTVEITFS